jgi:hypothetical protein
MLHKERGMPLPLAQQLVNNYLQYQRLYLQDKQVLGAFSGNFSSDVALRTVPVFDEDIFDLAGLAKINTFLFPPAPSGG